MVTRIFKNHIVAFIFFLLGSADIEEKKKKRGHAPISGLELFKKYAKFPITFFQMKHTHFNIEHILTDLTEDMNNVCFLS